MRMGVELQFSSGILQHPRFLQISLSPEHRVSTGHPLVKDQDHQATVVLLDLWFLPRKAHPNIQVNDHSMWSKCFLTDLYTMLCNYFIFLTFVLFTDLSSYTSGSLQIDSTHSQLSWASVSPGSSVTQTFSLRNKASICVRLLVTSSNAAFKVIAEWSIFSWVFLLS